MANPLKMMQSNLPQPNQLHAPTNAPRPSDSIPSTHMSNQDQGFNGLSPNHSHLALQNPNRVSPTTLVKSHQPSNSIPAEQSNGQNNSNKLDTSSLPVIEPSTMNKKRPAVDSSENGSQRYGIEYRAKRMKKEGRADEKHTRGSITNAYGMVIQTSPLASNTHRSTSAKSLPHPDPIDESARPSLMLPSHLAWFDMNQIHDLEKSALPEFFVERQARSSNKNPEIYREYRDFIIHTYQQNPSHYLNFTACRRSLAGDSCAIMRVFDFLEQVGLINYAINPDSQGIFPPMAPLPNPSDSTLSMLAFDTKNSVLNAINENLAMRPPLSIPLDATSTNAPTLSVFCSQCNNELMLLYYQHTKEHALCICTDCFGNSNFPSDSSSVDFKKIDLRQRKIKSEERNLWTNEEKLKLLEAVESFGADWSKVASHVGSKDKESCILQYIRLPIEDPYLSGPSLRDKVGLDLQEAGAINITSNCYVNHPINSLITFLLQSVSPQCAAAASKAAIEAYAASIESLSNKNGSVTSMVIDSPSILNEVKNPNMATGQLADDSTAAEVAELASASLGAATLKATLLAEKSDRDISGLILQLVDAYVKKINLKMKYFEDMDKLLAAEWTRLEMAKNQLYGERLQLICDQRAAKSSYTTNAIPEVPIQDFDSAPQF